MLERDEETLRRQVMIEHMFGDMLAHHFATFAAAFAVVDQQAAEASLRTMEHAAAAGLTQLRDEILKGAGGDDMLVEVAHYFTAAFKDAREKMAQARKPH